MAMCKFCGQPFSWGLQEDGKWIPLIPIGEEGELDRWFQDHNGVLRADHREICSNRGGPSVRIARLAKPIPAREVIQPRELFSVKRKSKKRRFTDPDPDTGEIKPIEETK